MHRSEARSVVERMPLLAYTQIKAAGKLLSPHICFVGSPAMLKKTRNGKDAGLFALCEKCFNHRFVKVVPVSKPRVAGVVGA